MTDDEFRALALGMPEATERSHHGFPSWRVRGKIFATMPEPGAANVMADEGVIREAVAENPAWCHERWWGKRLAALTVDLGPADDVVVREVVAEAWRRKAPAHVVRAHPDVG